jgi:hypothetical protein
MIASGVVLSAVAGTLVEVGGSAAPGNGRGTLPVVAHAALPAIAIS